MIKQMARKSKKRKKNPSSSSIPWLAIGVGVAVYFLSKGSGSTTFTPATPKEDVKKKVQELYSKFSTTDDNAEKMTIAKQLDVIFAQIGAKTRAATDAKRVEASPEQAEQIDAAFTAYLLSYGVTKEMVVEIGLFLG